MLAVFASAPIIGGGIAAAVDPAWAIPANTLLLILQVVAVYYFGRRVDSKANDVQDKVTQAHSAATDAASASSSAASAAADAARIAKEIGGFVREAQRVNSSATGPTDPPAGAGA